MECDVEANATDQSDEAVTSQPSMSDDHPFAHELRRGCFDPLSSTFGNFLITTLFIIPIVLAIIIHMWGYANPELYCNRVPRYRPSLARIFCRD